MSAPLSNPTISNEDADREFKPWRCGDEFQYPPPKTGSDPDEHWKTVVNYLLQKERGRCEVWKDEVDKLLVFAGLFSAVVTGLLVDSYKSLSEDPIQALLAQLVAQGANQTVAVMSESGSSGRFSASESNKRVNALWFLSLVLSLATALLGIVAQQWLREQTRPSLQNTALRQLPGLLHMYSDAFDRFFVPQLFTTLPLLLIISVVLFLIGMVDFLWAMNHQVAIPMSIAVFFVFIFLLVTTVYPALQSPPNHIPTSRKSSMPRAPCPYKSPQSSAFYILVFYVRWGFATSFDVLHKFYTRSNTPLSPLSYLERYLQKSWLHHAGPWLTHRDLDILKFHRDEALENLCSKISPFELSTTTGI
ncbi:hypothetical protein CPB83DRAFT_893582 [Crepidotus variabilis]|uniref:DUF6535 domain-containing protein n=1 Tax=Crepidotus variabilis TaxID=179855 RepID=A0A9P6EI47_9AGAR|nr:hypothetical protein CPB83DRAFT_893582 [Crepidotus variabilis]